MKKSTVKRLASLFLAMVMLVGAIAVEPSTVTAAATQTEQEQVSIKLNQTKKTIYVGEYTTVTVVKTKDGKTTGFETKSVTYKTSNKKIATVTSKGVVKGIKAGKATITVTSKSNSKVKSKFTVTVKKAPKTIRRLSKYDFDATGFLDNTVVNEDTGKYYVNYIDYSKEDNTNSGAYLDYTCKEAKTFITTRGIKLGSSKKTVLSKYPSKDRDQAYTISKYRKAALKRLHKLFDTKNHTVKDYAVYKLYYKNKVYSIEFVFDQNDKVMAINY